MSTDAIVLLKDDHKTVEETIFYPEARKAVPETEDRVLESVEEHHVEEEEKDWFPEVRKQLQELGARMAVAKADALSDPLALQSA